MLQDYVTEISSALVEVNSMDPEVMQRIEKLINEVVSGPWSSLQDGALVVSSCCGIRIGPTDIGSKCGLCM